MSRGMNKHELVVAKGYPDRVQRVLRATRIYEMWFYQKDKLAIYLEDGKVFQ